MYLSAIREISTININTQQTTDNPQQTPDTIHPTPNNPQQTPDSIHPTPNTHHPAPNPELLFTDYFCKNMLLKDLIKPLI